MATVTRDTFTISGFGGAYEDMCQKMLWRGVAHLEAAKPSVEMWTQAHSYKNVFGLLITEGDELKALEAAMMRDDDDVTGAMHQAVMGHLRFIHMEGLDKWREHLVPHRPEPGDRFKWTGEL